MVQTNGPSTEFPRRYFLDPEKRYLLEWKYEHGAANDNGQVTFRVTVKTTGYVGFGLSRNGGMKGADIVIGWVHDGRAYLHDMHGVGNEIPVLDDKTNWILKGGKEENGFTQLTFYRQLDTCDDQDIKIETGAMKVIYSYNEKDPVGGVKSVLYHGTRNRGSNIVYFDDDQQPSFIPEPAMKTKDLTVKNVSYDC
ncbi:DBH-like monooxygenase protein 2 homolog [Tubulanus polymorphus]|uniref:DBH-like monooxygenase protein 2 homolog n=1 Tax=Tubulanus polymorphus TaxID=672921 RepID=UPI003DA2D980